MRKVSPLAEAAIIFGFVLLGCLVAGQWLNTARHLMAADSTTACADNLHRLNLAVSQYAQDNDELLPPMQNAQAFKTATLPYGGDPTVFNCPDTGRPYTPNAAISQKSISSLGGDTSAVEVARDSQPHEDGLYTVVFFDGTVQHGGVVVGDANNPNTLVVSRAKQLGLAVNQYEQDYDETLPPMHNPQEFQTAIFPYTHSHQVFNSPNGQPFVPNAALSGAAIVSISNPAATVLFQDTPPYVGGAPTIAYVDGHVTHTALAQTHLLWRNGNGTAAIWTVNSDGSFTSTPGYGPIPGWTARMIADGADGKTRLLWTRSDGQSSVWTVSDADGSYTSTPGYGPYDGGNWNVVSLAVGPDNLTRLQWKHSPDGQSSVWTVAGDGTFTSTPAYGPYSPWTAGALAVGGDNLARLLWGNGNGAFSLWTVAANGSYTSTQPYGPIPNWSPSAIAGGSDANTRLLLNRSDGAMAVWTVAPNGSFTSTPLYGPIPNWSVQGLAVGPDALSRVLWSRSDGMSSVWTINGNGSYTSTPGYGPYPGWNAVALSAEP